MKPVTEPETAAPSSATLHAYHQHRPVILSSDANGDTLINRGFQEASGPPQPGDGGGGRPSPDLIPREQRYDGAGT